LENVNVRSVSGEISGNCSGRSPLHENLGDQFRVAFSCIGDICSLIPSHVKVMALTATATRDTLDSVVQRLSLKVPAVIAIYPNRSNISYELLDKTTIDEFTTGICKELKSKGIEFPKTVIFVGLLLHLCNIKMKVWAIFYKST